MRFVASCIRFVGLAIAAAAIWLNNLVGGTVGAGGFVQQCQRFLQTTTARAKRVARVLPWLMALSLVLIVIGLRTPGDSSQLMLFVVFAFWGIISLVFAHGLDIISQRLNSLRGAMHMVGMFSLFMFWFSFMSLTGALMWYSWKTSLAILCFFTFMHVRGMITGSRTPWARWLLVGSIWIYILVGVLHVNKYPVVVSINHFFDGLMSRTSVETDNATRGVRPDPLEQVEPDSFYVTNRGTKFWSCGNCFAGGVFDPAKVTGPLDLPRGTWIARSPEHPEVVVFELRRYVVGYSARGNNPDGGFTHDPNEAVFVPVDALIARSMEGGRSETKEAIAALPRWWLTLGGFVLIILLVLVVWNAVREKTPRLVIVRAPAAGGNNGHP